MCIRDRLTDHGAMYGIKNFTNYANDKINGDKLAQIKSCLLYTSRCV